MPDRKITDLVDGAPLQPTDEFVVARGGDNFKIDGAEVVSAVTKHDVTLAGNTAGVLALVSSGTMTLAGGNNVTVSQAGNAVTISGAATASQTVQTQNVVDVTLSGNTSGALALVSSGTLTLAGGNNITLSQAGNAITISGANAGGAQTGISGIANSQTTYTSGTVSLSELGAITIRSSTGQHFQFEVPATSSLSATGVVSISVNGSTVSIGAPAQTGISGVANSQTTYTSGTVSLSELGAITIRSTTGNQYQFSVNAQSVQPETQTFIGGISASDTLYTSGTVRLTGVGGGVTVSSNTGQRVDISVAAPVAQTVQTQNLVDVTLSGNTTGALALISSGTMTLAGGNNVTLSQAGNAVTISAASQSVQAETQTFIGGISASDTLYTSGTVRITGVGGGVTVSSNTGQRIDISVAAQSVQPETQTFVAGIQNSQTTYTSGTVNLSVVAGNLTIRSTTGQAFQFSMSQTVQPETQTAISGIANSQTTYTSGTVSLSELGAITIRSTTGNQYQFSVNSQTVQTQNVVDVTLAGNSTSAGGGFALISSGTMTLAGGNNITLSQNANAVTISAAAAIAQTNQSGNLYASSNTFGTSSGTYDARTISIAGSGAVSIAASNSGWVVSAPVQTNQAGSNYAIGNTFGTSSGTHDARTLSIAGDGMISVAASNSGWRISATQSVQAETQTFVGGIGNSQTTYTSGTVNLSVVAGQLTIRSTTGNAFQFSASQSVQAETQTAISGLANSQTTYTSGTVSLSELGAITIRSTTGNQFQFSVNAQTNQTGISGIANSQTTYTSGTVSLSELGAITIRSTTGNQYQLSVNAQTAQTQSNIQAFYDGANSISTGTVRLTDANGVTFSINAQTLSASVNQSISMFAVSNTTQSSSGTAHKSALSFGGAGVASVGVTGGSVVISVPAGGGAGFSAGVSTGGNTAGATGISGTQLVLVGTNMVSLSQTTGANGATVSINATQSVQTQGVPLMGVSTGGATSGDTTVNSGTRFVLVGTNITMSQGTAANATTVTVSAPATSSLSATGQVSISTNGSTISIGAPNPAMSFRHLINPLLMGATQGIGASGATQTTVTAWVMPMSLPRDLVFNNLLLAAHNSFSSATTSISSVNYSYSMGASLGFYTLTGSTMSLVTSFSNSLGYSNATAAAVGNMSLTARVGYGGSSTTKSTQGGAGMSAIMSSINSVRQIPFNWTTLGQTLTRGQYWAVAAFSALTGGANQASLSQVGFESNFSTLGSGQNPPAMMKNTASVTSPYPFLGLATLVNSSNSLMPVSFNTSNITTATATANTTAWQSLWMPIYSSHSD